MSTTELKLYSASGDEVGKTEVPVEIFATEGKRHLLHQMVRWQRAKWRAGTHSTLTRAACSGGGRKPWKQKGTGNARAGSNTSPLWVGGGIAHGPKPRNYEFRLNKKEKFAALAGALSTRNQEGQLFVINSFGLSDVKTKQALNVISALGIKRGEGALIVCPREEETVQKSFRNIKRVKVVSPEGLNVYDVLSHKYIILAESIVRDIGKHFGLLGRLE